MVQVDLITGFLGSGKTTFMRHYARYMVQQGWNVCILDKTKPGRKSVRALPYVIQFFSEPRNSGPKL